MGAIRFLSNVGGLATSVAFLGAVAALPVSSPSQSPKKPATASFERDVLPVLKTSCLPCHSGAQAQAGLDLARFKSAKSVMENAVTWEKVATNVSTGHMPPAGMPPLSKAKRSRMVTWIQTTLAADCGEKDPGRVTMRRLNRAEYDNTVRDLVGLDLHLAADNFPSDDVGYGFDNIGDVLSISPLLMEKYLSAAETISRKAVQLPLPTKVRVDASELRQGSGNGPSEVGQIFFSGGPAYLTHHFAGSGPAKIRVSASGDQAGPDRVRMAVLVDGKKVQEFEVPTRREQPRSYEVAVTLEAGDHQVGVEFLNDYYAAGPPPQDRNLFVQYLEIDAPGATWEQMPPAHRKIVFLKPTGDNHFVIARKALNRFATRAFRRPVKPSELDRLCQIVSLVEKDGQPFERGIQVAVQAVLSSPHFLFRVESDHPGGKLNGYELASRLSYFLWSSMPDDRLIALAASGKLSKPSVLALESQRMLKDPRSSALGENFAAQWLNLRKLNIVQPDPKLYPGFSESLRTAMMSETRQFFDHVLREDRPVTDFLNAKYSFMNEELAKHYGISGVSGNEFRQVSLVGTPRSGILTQASILTLTSNPTRTSPVKRGKWVLDQLLNQPPPPPPPNVPDLKGKEEVAGKTLRQRMELHRKDPVCASCHQRMDPIGFSLENFDGTGKWRTQEDGTRIDASGVLPNGTKFDGPDELRGLLVSMKGDFYGCLADKMLTFALGRGTERSDKCYLDDISKTLARKPQFSTLVTQIVQSEPFRQRKPIQGKSK